jgi:hypothetical protein
MLRLQLSEQDQHQQSENENENDALVGNSLTSAYGSISSANGHSSTRSKNCPSVPSVNAGVLSLSTEGASAGDEDYNEEDNNDISMDEDDDDIDSEISYEDSSEDEEEQAFYQQGKGKIR